MIKLIIMKKIMKYIWAVPALLLAACSQDQLVEAPQASTGEEVVISVNMPNQSNSRVSFDNIATGALTWDADDELRLYDLDSQGNTTASFTKFKKLSASGTKAQFIGTLPTDMSTEKLLTVYNKNVKHEKSNFGERPDLKTPMTQKGNNDASHLAKMIHMGVKCTGDQLKKGAVTLNPLCALVTFKIQDYPKDQLGSILQSLTWIVNYNKPENQFKRELKLTNLSGRFNAYMLFYADETKLVSGGNIAVKFTGEGGSAGSTTGEASAEKVYENGQRYAVTISYDNFPSWGEINTDVAVTEGEILAKVSGDIQINEAKAAEWEVTKAADGVSYSIHRIDKKAFTEVPSNLLADASNALLQEISLAEGVTSIADNAFSTGAEGGMPVALTTIQLPASVNTIGASAFAGCTQLTTVDINKVTTFGKDAFKGHQLTVVGIPANATDNGAFNGSATEYTLNGGAIVAENAYSGVPFKSINVKAGAAVTMAANSFAQCTIATFNFYGTTGSSLASGFVDVASAKNTNLKLNVQWLNPGNDPNAGSSEQPKHPNAGVTNDTRTPKPIYDTKEPKKIIGGTWMGVNWKSITFVNPDGTEITQQDINDNKYPALKETGAVWGDPKAEPAPAQ